MLLNFERAVGASYCFDGPDGLERSIFILKELPVQNVPFIHFRDRSLASDCLSAPKSIACMVGFLRNYVNDDSIC